MIIDYLKELILQNFGFSPTKEQGKVVDSLCEFILSKNQAGVFVPRGFPGPGKTSLVGALVKTMEQLPHIHRQRLYILIKLQHDEECALYSRRGFNDFKRRPVRLHLWNGETS